MPTYIVAKNNQFSKEPNVQVSATLGISLWNELRDLQVKGHKEAHWSDVMRRGARVIIDASKGINLEQNIERLTKRFKEVHDENTTLKEQLAKYKVPK